MLLIQTDLPPCRAGDEQVGHLGNIKINRLAPYVMPSVTVSLLGACINLGFSISSRA